jgi:hypothetical protein
MCHLSIAMAVVDKIETVWITCLLLWRVTDKVEMVWVTCLLLWQWWTRLKRMGHLSILLWRVTNKVEMEWVTCLLLWQWRSSLRQFCSPVYGYGGDGQG